MIQNNLPVAGEIITISILKSGSTQKYPVKVLIVGVDSMQITMPFDNGSCLSLTSGTELQLNYGEKSFNTHVLNRILGQVPMLVVSIPVYSDAKENTPRKNAKFICITSGKGGAGKSIFSLNLAFTLVRMGFKVCLADLDLGTANLDLLLGIKAELNLGDLMAGKTIQELLINVAPGLCLLPGSSGIGKIANLDHLQLTTFIHSLEQLTDKFDYVLMDTGAGISDDVISITEFSDLVILLSTPDPTSITDAYALLKVASVDHRVSGAWSLVVNKAESDEADFIQANFSRTALRNLGIKLGYLGYIPESNLIAASVRNFHPLMSIATEKEEALEVSSFRNIAVKLVELPIGTGRLGHKPDSRTGTG